MTNLPYDICVALKAKGFSFQHDADFCIQNGCLFPERYGDDDNNEPILHTPTLEELIEACGRGFRSLTFHSNGDWEAYMYSPFQNGREGRYFGSTPLIAVANLYLAITK